MLVPFSLVESELIEYKKCAYGGEILNIEEEPYWQNAYHVVSCGKSVNTFMIRYCTAPDCTDSTKSPYVGNTVI